jgi:hypothetical protein
MMSLKIRDFSNIRGAIVLQKALLALLDRQGFK